MGVPDLAYEHIATGVWDLRAQIANTFSYPSTLTPTLFLLGDAAHTLPPTRGGYGANTGISDAHNISWKLASVIKDLSSPSLLSSCDTERRPVSWLRHDQVLAGPDYASYRRDGEDYGQSLDTVAVELGQLYYSDIIVTEDNLQPPTKYSALKPDELTGRPGSRAPHVWLTNTEGQRVSTLSVLGNGWTVVTMDPKWKDIAALVTSEVRTPLSILCINNGGLKEERTGDFAKLFGLSDGAASLVRPDGYVAWRDVVPSDFEDAKKVLIHALKRTACTI